jgi:hypothetical protein
MAERVNSPKLFLLASGEYFGAPRLSLVGLASRSDPICNTTLSRLIAALTRCAEGGIACHHPRHENQTSGQNFHWFLRSCNVFGERNGAHGHGFAFFISSEVISPLMTKSV